MKNLLTILTIIVATQFASAQLPSYVPANGLVAWYPFSGNANDLSNNSNNGTVNGATLTSDRNSNPNSAYSFNGATSEINIPSSSSITDFPNGQTLSFWMKISAYPTDGKEHYLIDKTGNLGDITFYQAFISDYSNVDNIVYRFAQSSSISSQGTAISFSNIPLNQWFHLCFTTDLTVTKTYINGVNILTYSHYSPIGVNSNPLKFGNNSLVNPTNAPYNGLLDDIGIWNRALTQSEITQLYNACTTAPIANITPDGATTFCAGNSVNLTCNIPNATYQWKKNTSNISGATSKTYTAKNTGNYSCIVTNACGTATSNTINVTSQPNTAVTITATGNISFCAGDSVVLNASNPGAGYSIQWYRSNISILNATALSYTAKQPGAFKLVSKNNSNGCSRISSTTINTTVNCRISNPNLIAVQNNTEPLQRTDLSNNKITKSITIFPNPNNGSFTFECENIEQEGTANLQIINTFGQSIYNKEVSITYGNIQEEVNLGSTITKGIYVIRLTINGEKYADSKVMLQ